MTALLPQPSTIGPLEQWGTFSSLARTLPDDALVVADARVLRLHPAVGRALARHRVLAVRGGERLKSLRNVERILQAAVGLSRQGWLVALGGGTVGDTCAVAAHLYQRGVRLLQVPTTTLAAADSSVGGKGAVDVAWRGEVLKNLAGVFHFPERTWLCPALFTTLSERQLREGRIEAWKMFASLDAAAFRRHLHRRPSLSAWLRDARRLKQEVCARDPFDATGERAVLNFGHTVGHVLESASGLALSHGDAVGLGLRCALDVGRALGVTPPEVALEAEAGLEQGAGILPRSALARAFKGVGPARFLRLLAADKKRAGGCRMVLLEAVGRAGVYPVPEAVLVDHLGAWQRGAAP